MPKKLRALASGKIGNFANFVAGGSALTLLIDRRWGWGGSVVAVYLSGVLKPWRLLPYVTGVMAGGLQLTIPLEPLDGRTASAADRRRHTRAAITSISTAFSSSTQIDMMLCSGFQVVGTAAFPGWVHQSLFSLPANSTLRVLLLDPDCPAGQQRGQRVMDHHGPEAYKNGVSAVTDTFYQLCRTKGLNVELRYYQEPPVWQMLGFPREMFVMLASLGPTDRSPIWVFRRDGEYSMGRGLTEVFKRRWEHSTTREVDLSVAPAFDAAALVSIIP